MEAKLQKSIIFHRIERWSAFVTSITYPLTFHKSHVRICVASFHSCTMHSLIAHDCEKYSSKTHFCKCINLHWSWVFITKECVSGGKENERIKLCTSIETAGLVIRYRIPLCQPWRWSGKNGARTELYFTYKQLKSNETTNHHFQTNAR